MEKRKLRVYKAEEASYRKALHRAAGEGGHLATLLENVVKGYSEGLNVALTSRPVSKKLILKEPIS